MKRCEKLGIDLNTVGGLERIISLKCNDIGDRYSVGFDGYCKYPTGTSCCAECIAERLIEEIPTKKVQRGTTYTNFKNAYRDFVNDVSKAESFVDWLCEEIEVEANEDN